MEIYKYVLYNIVEDYCERLSVSVYPVSVFTFVKNIKKVKY